MLWYLPYLYFFSNNISCSINISCLGESFEDSAWVLNRTIRRFQIDAGKFRRPMECGLNTLGLNYHDPGGVEFFAALVRKFRQGHHGLAEQDLPAQAEKEPGEESRRDKGQRRPEALCTDTSMGQIGRGARRHLQGQRQAVARRSE